MLHDVKIEQVKAVSQDPDGTSIVLKAQAAIGRTSPNLEVAITTDLAPSVAIELLATTAKARAALRWA